MTNQPRLNLTVAMSVLLHGEAVRFNRGKGRNEDFDFKYMEGGGKKYPYVSSQSFKKHWREALHYKPSPIHRQGTNQGFTEGDPITYVDDDLFGYMIAGAEVREDSINDTNENDSSQEELLDSLKFTTDRHLKEDGRSLLNKFMDGKALSEYILTKLSSEERDLLAANKSVSNPGSKPPALNAEVGKLLIDILNRMLPDRSLYDKNRFTAKEVTDEIRKLLKADDDASIYQRNRLLLGGTFKSFLEKAEKQEPTKRTAPIRMHAPVAFCGIRMAKDFQTLSRDVALTGKNSVLNPSGPGIYTAWLKTRILIEAHRIGKFYISKNLDILSTQVKDHSIHKEVDPYSHRGNTVDYIELSPIVRAERVSAAIQALANINKDHGPASGALHDGSMRPQAFIAAFMNCCDSPFDFVWQAENDRPHLNPNRLAATLRDNDDLFADRTIYIGLPLDTDDEAIADQLEKVITANGFKAVIGSPRKMLQKMATDAKSLAESVLSRSEIGIPESVEAAS